MHRCCTAAACAGRPAVQRIAALRTEQPRSDADIGLMLDFLAAATRGIVR
jgi:hypothetical protein